MMAEYILKEISCYRKSVKVEIKEFINEMEKDRWEYVKVIHITTITRDVKGERVSAKIEFKKKTE